MSPGTLGIDAYQLTTLAAHSDAGRAGSPVEMAFFTRRLQGRNFALFCGLRSLLEHAAAMRLDEDDLAVLEHDPLIGPALRARPALRAALLELEGFLGEIDALPEGTPAFAGPALRDDGRTLTLAGAPITLYTPLLQVRTDLLRAKWIETPWLGRINYMSMVASKAARIVTAARGKPVFELGARRTHPAAAVDASYAAYVAGCTATSNLAALRRHGVPVTGTMDHFFVQASERPGESRAAGERAAFARVFEAFPAAILLVDTYDAERGIRHAVEATAGRLAGIRLDSGVTPATVAAARRQLDALGAPHARIVVSDGLDEHRIAALEGADGFGVGESITCSPDAAAGIGAVAKLTVNGYGVPTMKLAGKSGKATLPGRLQVHRYPDHDRVALADEAVPSGGRALLRPVWRGRAALPQPTLPEVRAHAQAELAALPPAVRALAVAAPGAAPPWPLVASDGLIAVIQALAARA